MLITLSNKYENPYKQETLGDKGTFDNSLSNSPRRFYQETHIQKQKNQIILCTHA
tara:strand:+ start:8050 stop:8214 length:165 start_codon:yes stop_codon:yes gene_type:complete